jgi:hypothetical protein
MVTVDVTEPPRAALYAHQGANGRCLIIAAAPARLPARNTKSRYEGLASEIGSAL